MKVASNVKLELIVTLEAGEKVSAVLEVPHRRISDIEVIKHLQDQVIELVEKKERECESPVLPQSQELESLNPQEYPGFLN